MRHEPDLELGRRFLAANPPPGALLLCGVTGSHQYGFPSPDSDLDLKGIHLAPLESMLGLDLPEETHDRLEVFEGVECDLTTHEAKRALNLLLRGNGNMLERIFSPYQLRVSPELEELRELAGQAISKRFFAHYRGFFRGVQREHEQAPRPEAKSLLYSFRVALTGVHLLETGRVEADLTVLAPEHGFDEVLDVVKQKQATEEHVVLDANEDARFRKRWADLETALERAHEQSSLPDEPPNRDRLSDWLIESRRSPN